MNMMIFEKSELGPEGLSSALPRADRRYEHVKKILKKNPGDIVEAGIATDSPFGPAPLASGTAQIISLEEKSLVLRYSGSAEPEPLAPIRLILGFPRPIQAARIFKDLVSLGLAEIILTGTALGEKSYLESDFFSAKQYRRPLLDGAEQAANPRLPLIRQYWSLDRSLAALDGPDEDTGDFWKQGLYIALHPDSSVPSFGAILKARLAAPGSAVTIAIGSERGWTKEEIQVLKKNGFNPAGLGSRILKTETAASAAVSLALASMGRM